MTIDLGDYNHRDAIVLSGRPKGEQLRANLNLDRIDRNPSERCQIIVPERIVSLNSSFFSGLFGPSIRVLGEPQFRQKFSFQCSQPVRDDVEDGIREALNRANPLGKPV
jgi:hypothetical protein